MLLTPAGTSSTLVKWDGSGGLSPAFCGWQSMGKDGIKAFPLKKLALLSACLLGSVCLAVAQDAPQETASPGIPVEISSDGTNTFNAETGLAVAEKNVIVRYGEDVIYADQVTFDNRNKEVSAKGNVRIFSNNTIYRGEFITYNLNNHEITSQGFRTVEDRIFAAGDDVQSPQEGEYVIHGGIVTTEDRENPSYYLKANTVEIYPDDRVVMKNVFLYVGGIPCMWVPVLSKSLKKDQGTVLFDVGSTSRLGIFTTIGYNWSINRQWEAGLYGSYYSRRGFGGGINASYSPNALSTIDFTSFNISDNGTDIGVNPTTRPIPPPTNRYRYAYDQTLQLSDDFYSAADINVWSDRNVTQDFFPREYEKEIQPDNYIDAMYYNSNFTATLLARAQVNNLFEVAERKPEFIVEFKRQKLFNLPISYEGESSITNFELQFDKNEPTYALLNGQPVPTGYGAYRYDTFHQFLYPRQYFGWLSVTPRAGIRGTFYKYYDSNSPLATGSDENFGRGIFNAGLESSFKLSRTWGDVQNEALGIDGLRHVAEPSINLAWTQITNRAPSEFAGFDDRIPNTRAQPLNYPAFNSIDSIGNRTVIRPGIRNKIQTHRDGENADLVDWYLYADLNVDGDPNYGNKAPGLPGMSSAFLPEVYNEVAVKPVPWLNLNVYAANAVADSGFTEVNSELTWQVHPALDLSLGQRYLTNADRFLLDVQDSNLLTTGAFWRLNESWQFEQVLNFEADDGTLQEQRYTVYRDLGAWSTSLTTAFRDNKSVSDEFVVYLSITLKAFPQSTLKFSN